MTRGTLKFEYESASLASQDQYGLLQVEVDIRFEEGSGYYHGMIEATDYEFDIYDVDRKKKVKFSELPLNEQRDIENITTNNLKHASIEEEVFYE